MNSLDKQYQALLQDILDNGVQKSDRTGTGTISVFGRQIRHDMSEGFPILTTKKIHWKSIVTELLWFLRGETNIKYLVDNDCHIWDGDAYKNYCEKQSRKLIQGCTYQEFLEKIKTDDEFAKNWGELGPIYGKQWRSWKTYKHKINYEPYLPVNKDGKVECYVEYVDQIANSLNLLKTDPDSRRNKVSAWNVGEMNQMTLPPCHTDFQFYTRELSAKERWDWYGKNGGPMGETKLVALMVYENEEDNSHIHSWLKTWAPNVPTRAISLMWNQRSVDTFLGLPFNIASYGLLLEIIAKEVNMVPDELIGNLGDVHLYSNHIEQAKEQIGKIITFEERVDWWFHNRKPNRDVVDEFDRMTQFQKARYLNQSNVPYSTKEPYELPNLWINDIRSDSNSIIFDTEKWSHKDFVLENYQSHPIIKAPLSN